MHILTILTLVAAGLIVAALAFYLIAIAMLLAKTLSTLKSVGESLRIIAQRVEPVEPALSGMNEDLLATREVLARVVKKVEAKSEQATSDGKDSSDGKQGSRKGRFMSRVRAAVRDDR